MAIGNIEKASRNLICYALTTPPHTPLITNQYLYVLYHTSNVEIYDFTNR